MSDFSETEITVLGDAEEVRIAAYRPDGTLAKAVPIWVVRIGDDLIIRSYRGTAGAWFRTVLRSGRARIRAGAIDRDVRLERVSEERRTAVDAEYRRKYGRYGRLADEMASDEVAATTLLLTPA